VWKKAWAELSQQRIRGWVERIVRHIKEVIRLDGGNEYKEGRGENSIN
jgi:siroheme synthase